MKRFYQYFFIKAPFVLGALLLCFGFCQSSDNVKAFKGAMVENLPLKAQIGNTSTRVGMTDSYSGGRNSVLDSLFDNGIHIVTGVIANIKNKLMSM